jgi:hypothetical protein
MTLNIVAVHVGDYCGRGREYLEKLFDGIDEHLPRSTYKTWCITDDPKKIPGYLIPIAADVGVRGWWNKCALFRPGIFPNGERVLYFDLDTIITGDLSDIAAYTGKFAALRDFNFKGNMNSGLMAWEAGTLDHIWRVWQRCGRPQFDPGGDQAWIEDMQPTADYWQEILPGQVVSYKVDCQQGVPDKARVVCFHGKPRPHEVNWEIGGHNGN